MSPCSLVLRNMVLLSLGCKLCPEDAECTSPKLVGAYQTTRWHNSEDHNNICYLRTRRFPWSVKPAAAFRGTSSLKIEVSEDMMSYITPQSVLRQVHSLFQSEFAPECDVVLHIPISRILSFPQGHPVAVYSLFLVFPPLLPLIFPSVASFRKHFLRNMWPIQ
jgi:hypothetical protein